MPIDTWDEIRTAYHVARVGTVSGAAEALGVHHATVIRHVDALEKRLGVKLFQRHARGYTPTEAGRDLLQVAQATEDQFAQLAARLHGAGAAVTGELVVTSLPDFSTLLTPVLVSFQQAHPGLTVRYVTDTRLLRLEYGEAHVAIRAGATPDEPDNVVQPFLKSSYALYAAQSYIDRYGLPAGPEEFAAHRFVGQDGGAPRAPFYRWMKENVPDSAITYRATEPAALVQAVLDGAGIGFLPAWRAGEGCGVVEVMPARAEWRADIWLVTHVDLHRTPKVQAFLQHLKEAAKAWPVA